MKKFAFYFLLLTQFVFSLSASAQVNADFTATVTSGCSPLVVYFTNTSTGNKLSYTWYFGNGNQSNLKDPGAAYHSAGSYTVSLVVTDQNGNKDSVARTNFITVYKEPDIDFHANIKKGCVPMEVDFLGFSLNTGDTISSWTWDFGDGSVAFGPNPKHTYQEAGIYDVTLVAESNHGCRSSLQKNSLIIVSAPAKPNFTANVQNVCALPALVTFSIDSLPIPGASYTWDFGDGQTGSGLSPSHSYTSNGDYAVSLTLTDSLSCTATITKQAFIHVQEVEADFTQNIDSGCLPLQVTFANTTDPLTGGMSFAWDFGDGGSSNAQNPTHIYNSPGTYSVSLVSRTANGCTDTVIKSSIIKVVDAPVAAFSLSDSVACTGPLQVNFTDLSSNADTWLWDFGDGSTSTLQNPVHTYNQEGDYTVSLSITSSTSTCTSTFTKSNAVRISPPNAALAVDKQMGCIPFTVNFTNQGQAITGISSYFWDFGDGNTSTSASPSHTYIHTGVYTAKLTITTTDGCMDTTSVQIKTGTPPQADFTGSPLTICPDRFVDFTNLTNTHATQADSFYWMFGDGHTSTDLHPRHRYEAYGFYSVTLIAFNNGCPDSLVMENYVEVLAPQPKFTYSYDKCDPQIIRFTNTSQNYHRHIWWLGGADTTTAQNPVRTFSPGQHKIVIVTWNDSTGCMDAYDEDITVKPKLTVDLSANVTTGCMPLKVKFTGTSNYDVNWQWEFSDGQTSTSKDPEMTFDNPEEIDVRLTVKNADSCIATITKNDFIKPYGPKPGFTINTLSGCTPLFVQVVDTSTSTYKVVMKEWNFGDGTILVTDKDTVSHTYITPPAIQTNGYLITFTLYDSAGCRRFAQKRVMPSWPRPDFSYETIPGCGLLNYKFIPDESAHAGLGPLTFKWVFSDGSISTQKTPLRTYYTSGQHDVKLIMTDKNGCTDSITKTIDVQINVLTSDFSFSPAVAKCPDNVISFFDSSTTGFAKIVKWNWDFGDGTSSSLQNPQKLYHLPGQYTVRLITTDSLGCTDTFMSPKKVIVKGATGTFSVSAHKGCTPASVTFTGISKDASDFTWDMGNGVLLKGKTFTYTYTNPGTYIPLLILSDSFGCTYTLPPTDTIVIENPPHADFSYGNTCLNEAVQFSESKASNIASRLWEFGDGTQSSQIDPAHLYMQKGYYTVTLVQQSTFGCIDSVSKAIKIGSVEAAFGQSDTAVCAGTPVQFTDESTGDTSIIAWKWHFGDGNTSNMQNPQHTYTIKGIYSPSLVVWSASGCKDSIVGKPIKTGDTTMPVAPVIYRATVEDDHSVLIEFESSKEIDFVNYIICRKDASGTFLPIATLYDQSTTSYLDENLNTLQNSYCYVVLVRNACDITTAISAANPHCTVEMTATAQVNAARLDWNAYAGWQVGSYSILREDVNNKGSFQKITDVDGSLTNFIDTNILCYRTHVYKIIANKFDGSTFSVGDTAATTPIYIPNVPAPELLRATVEYDENPNKDDSEGEHAWVEFTEVKKRVMYYIVERSLNNKTFERVDSVFSNTGSLALYDHLAEANKESYIYRVRAVDSCGDVSPHSNIGKTILLSVDTVGSGYPQLSWTPYLDWVDGVAYYEIQLHDKNGAYTTIGQTRNGNITTFTDKFTDLNSQNEYCYRVVAHRKGKNITSRSNRACAPARATLYAPNAFTPNDDLLNDEFKVTGSYVKKFNMIIFDRWGTIIYNSNNMEEGWDGNYKGSPAPEDMYKYMINAQGADRRNFYLQGSFILMR